GTMGSFTVRLRECQSACVGNGTNLGTACSIMRKCTDAYEDLSDAPSLDALAQAGDRCVATCQDAVVKVPNVPLKDAEPQLLAASKTRTAELSRPTILIHALGLNEVALSGLKIAIGDTKIAPEELDKELPFAVGDFEVVAEAPGFEPVKQK